MGTAAMISRESKTKTRNIIISCTDYSQATIMAMNNIIKVKPRNIITAITVFCCDCWKLKLRDKRPLVDIIHIILASRAECKCRIALGPSGLYEDMSSSGLRLRA